MRKVMAFPVQTDVEYNGGMELRDYFAAKALPLTIKLLEYEGALLHAENIAVTAYQIANAMLLEREQKTWRHA